jgi:hypothetical protein
MKHGIAFLFLFVTKCKYIHIGIILLFFLITGCKENENNEPPLIHLISESGYLSNDTILKPGESFRVKLSAEKGSADLTNFVIIVNNGTEVRYLDSAMHSSSFSWNGILNKTAAKEESWTFLIRDRNGANSIRTIHLKSDTISAFNPLTTVKTIQLGAQQNTVYGGFCAFGNDSVYNIEAASLNQNLIDICYYFGPEGNTLASPGANIETGIYPDPFSPLSWSTKRETRFIYASLASGVFDSMQNDSLLLANYVPSLAKRKAKFLTANDCYYFKTASNKLGIFKVKQVTGQQAGNIIFEIKYQQ